MKRTRWLVLLVLTLTLWPGRASANMGLPMVALVLPAAWPLLVPIIVLEAAVGTRKAAVPFWVALRAQAVANVFSTIVGVPVAWFLLATLELICCGTALGLATPFRRAYAVTVQAPWLIPYEQDFWWMVPCALAVLTVLFCAVSIASEYPIVKYLVGADRSRAVWRWVIQANVLSYACLFAVTVVAAAAGERSGLDRIQRVFMPVIEPLVQAVFRVVRAIVG